MPLFAFALGGAPRAAPTAAGTWSWPPTRSTQAGEEWDGPAALEAFRGDGPGPDLTTMIVSADVSMHEITSTTPT